MNKTNEGRMERHEKSLLISVGIVTALNLLSFFTAYVFFSIYERFYPSEIPKIELYNTDGALILR